MTVRRAGIGVAVNAQTYDPLVRDFLRFALERYPEEYAKSGLLGPTVNEPIAIGYVTPAFAAVGTRVNAMVRGKTVPMEVRAMPFVPANYYRG